MKKQIVWYVPSLLVVVVKDPKKFSDPLGRAQTCALPLCKKKIRKDGPREKSFLAKQKRGEGEFESEVVYYFLIDSGFRKILIRVSHCFRIITGVS
jgi:hypothetical protein